LHGGANEAVLRQLKAIRDSGKTVKEFVEDAKTSGQRISGLGHRVYKSYDPRAAIAKKYLQKIMERADTLKLPADERALFDVATELEKIALNDEYFVSRHLYPNVDFYTGLIYRAIGFDPSMFTTLFALGLFPVGSRSIVRCLPIRTPRSVVRVRCTPVIPNVITLRSTVDSCFFAVSWTCDAVRQALRLKYCTETCR